MSTLLILSSYGDDPDEIKMKYDVLSVEVS